MSMILDDSFENDSDGMEDAASAFSALAPLEESLDPDDSDDDQDIDTGSENDDIEDHDADEDDSDAEDSSDEEQEPEPAIPAPVSWDAAAKALFATLPPEAQKVISAREGERERFVQAKATEAAQHRKTAEALQQREHDLHQTYVGQIDQLATLIMPQRPSPELLRTDPQAYAYLQAQYETAEAQRLQLTQHAAQVRQQVQQQQREQEQAETQADLQRLATELPEWADPAKRAELLATLENVGRELGYTDELMAQARATDIIGLKKASEWKAKADKYDALTSKRMEAVRAAKGKPKVLAPGASQGRGGEKAQRLNQSMQKLQKTGSLDAAADVFRSMR